MVAMLDVILDLTSQCIKNLQNLLCWLLKIFNGFSKSREIGLTYVKSIHAAANFEIK